MESSRSDGGASLPPRKRLLAGLKQNGWLCSGEKNSNPNGEETRGRSDSDCCVICGGHDEEDSVKVKNGLRFVCVCNSCNVLLNSGGVCCFCFGRISNERDVCVAFSCCKCRHRAHRDCIPMRSSSRRDCFDDLRCFVCVDSLSSNGGKVELPGLGLGFESPKKEALALGLGFGDCCDSEGGACHSVVFSVDKTSGSSVQKCLDRKTLLDVCRPVEACCSTAESRTVDAVDGSGEQRGNCSIRKLEHLLKLSPLSLQELVVEARAEVAKAEEAVSVAKEAASRKAEEAAKAAAAAKEALNVAAVAAREEREMRAILRKKHSLKHGTKHEVNQVEDRRSKIDEGELKEGMGAVSKMSVLDDEELARRLHRAINSSPRISRSANSLVERDPIKVGGSYISRAHSQRPSLPKQQTRLRGSFAKKQEEKPQSKSESVNWGKLAHKTEPGSQSACGKFGGSPIDKLLQTLDHSETESSVGLLALNQDPSVHKPIAETEMIDSGNCTVAQISVTEYDEKASDAGRVLKELRVCNYSQSSLRDGNSRSVEPEVGNLEKLAETVAVVIEEENSRCQEDKMDRCIKEETASCSIKCIERVGTHQHPEHGEATSQKLGEKKKRPSLDFPKTNECGSRLSKSSRTPVHAGTYHGNIALDSKCSPMSNDSAIRLHARRSNSRSNLERRTKSISGDFPQESQGSARVLSNWHQKVLKPSESFAGNVNLSPLHSAPKMPLQSPAFASGASRKHV